MTAILRWLKQPSTLVGVGLVIGAGVYWLTRNQALAMLAAALPMGTITDNTAGLLRAIEALEDDGRMNALQLSDVKNGVNANHFAADINHKAVMAALNINGTDPDKISPGLLAAVARSEANIAARRGRMKDAPITMPPPPAPYLAPVASAHQIAMATDPGVGEPPT